MSSINRSTATTAGQSALRAVRHADPSGAAQPGGICARAEGSGALQRKSPVRAAQSAMPLTAGVADAAERVVAALKASSAVDELLLNSAIAADTADVHRFADVIARVGDCVVLRHHPKTYGQVNHISAMVIKKLSDGNYRIGVAHHESVNLAGPRFVDGAMQSTAGIRWDTYDTRALFASLGKELAFEGLPTSLSAIKHGFPSSTIVPCANPDRALAYIAHETMRSQKMVKSRALIREAAQMAAWEPIDGVPPYAYAPANNAANGHAFYTPALPGDSPHKRAAAMKRPERQVNHCFEYVAGVLMSADANGAEDMKLGTPGVALLLGPFARLVGGIPPTDEALEQMRRDGVKDLQSFEAFRWLGKRWGELRPAIRPWDLTSSRAVASKL